MKNLKFIKNLNRVAYWGAEWQRDSSKINSHTVDRKSANQFAQAYINCIKIVKKNKNIGKDFLSIGSGAGNVEKKFQDFGFNVIASEWSEDGINLIKNHNPELNCKIIDIFQFSDIAKYDVIFCRELYPLTRVNSFTDQYEVICNLIDGLKAGGILFITMSKAAHPHCFDIDLFANEIPKKSKIETIFSTRESVLRRIIILNSLFLNQIILKTLNIIFYLYFCFKNLTFFDRSIMVYAFVKK